MSGGQLGAPSVSQAAIRNSALIALRTPTVINARSISYHYGEGETRTPVLFDNTLQIGAGELAILTGPSGSGKTTLLTLFGTLRQLQEGSLNVLGQELAAAPVDKRIALRRQIGFIFQHHNLFGSLTALDNVRMAAGLATDPAPVLHARCADMLQRLGLDDRMHHVPARLSGGQRQRVAIARALVNRPRLVLADEPTAALDADSGANVMQLFRELANGPEKTTVLIVSHDHRLLHSADRIVNMLGGRIVSNVRPDQSIRFCKALRQSPDFGPLHLSESILAQLAERMAIERHAPGETIVREGTTGDAYYLVSSGLAEAYGGNQPRRVIAINDGFGEITSISHTNQTETVIAKTELELFVLGQQDAKEVLEQHDRFEDQLRLYYMNRQ